MGRGRAKAKQTKVARDLKYHTSDTDFNALQAELGKSSVLPQSDNDELNEPNYDADPYAKYYEEEDED
jgi:hypothetical protein